MSQTPEAPLLSPERLEQIKDRVDAHERVHIAVVAIRYGEDVPALLADRAAYRQQVATELAALGESLNRPDFNRLRALAYRLGIELPR